MARKKVTCPHCNAETYDTPSCGRCGGVLRQTSPQAPSPESLRNEVVNKFGTVLRAETIENNLQNVVLASFKSVQVTDDIALESTEVVVEKNKRQFVFTSTSAKVVRIGPGKYSMAKIMAAGGGRPAKDLATLVCEVSQAPITVTFTFPDKNAYANSINAFFPEHKKAALADIMGDILNFQTGQLENLLTCVRDTLNALSLRTSDNRLGSALLQLLISCENPIPLVRCRDAKATVDGETPFMKEGPTSQRVPLNEPTKPLLHRAWDWFYGHEKKSYRTFQTKQITMGELYDTIRYELAEAVANAVRDFEVAQLYDRADKNRNLLHESLKKYMQKTLQGYGLDVLDVVAFQFRSPEYEEFLQKHGDVALRERTFREIEQAEGELFKQKLTFEHGVFEHQQAIEEKQAIIEDDREANAARRADQLAAEQQDRWLTMDAKRLQFERQQQAAEDDRQHQQAMRALDLHERLQTQQTNAFLKLQDAEHKRRIEAVNLIAGKKPEEQLILAMQFNPELQQSFIAMQHAKSNEDKVAMAQQFQGQVQQIYGDQSDQSNALLIEAAKALGLAVGARVQDRAPPLQVKVEHVSGHGSAE